MISLDSFRVLRKLTVKEIQLEPKKVKALYQVEPITGETVTFELIYSYEQPWFDHKRPADVNLASMMLAQAALNYGLFFEIIEFDGLFDKADQQFIKEMMENTSREILTNKLLVKNEFLKPPFDELKPEKKERYTQSEIHFVNTLYHHLELSRENDETDPDKYAILSSGGKDSLLTYGLIKEFGEPYPVFINEAGRHWFTAVNAYRFFQKNEPNTMKPWCNSDRLFNWMLKQLPFIKENYAAIRSDMYPLRLWTVAVFLFGVLPIARKKGIGNILIGNEYDTTVTGNRSGIRHFNGLYDQSKYFDNRLTRYYRSKGWKINQFSALRSLSELLIMKVLVKRYPELQEHQVSCHAAHEENGRMYPCGKCEKCRRIVGMLKALDENPARCGYSKFQIEQGLKALETHSVKQIGSDASHLYYLMLRKKLITRNDFTARAAREHAEITRLRFDHERSNLEDMPDYVRRPLFDILVQYADGAVKRVDKRWVDVRIDDEFLNDLNYKWDGKQSGLS
jgi:hypothetical protein